MRQGVVGSQTRRAVQAGGKPVVLAFAGLLAGCMSSHLTRLDAWGGAQNCHFAHVTKKEFEAALRHVFDASDPKVYGLHPEEGGALVEQHWALDVIFGSPADSERWQLEYAPAGDGIDVHAQMERAAGFSRTRNETVHSGDTTDYQLLWSRVQYVLGNRRDWPRCHGAFQASGAGLCGADSSSAPPLRLARFR